jgi:hypothetical protein
MIDKLLLEPRKFLHQIQGGLGNLYTDLLCDHETGFGDFQPLSTCYQDLGKAKAQYKTCRAHALLGVCETRTKLKVM